MPTMVLLLTNAAPGHVFTLNGRFVNK